MVTVATMPCCGSYVRKEGMYWEFWEVIVGDFTEGTKVIGELCGAIEPLAAIPATS